MHRHFRLHPLRVQPTPNPPSPSDPTDSPAHPAHVIRARRHPHPPRGHSPVSPSRAKTLFRCVKSRQRTEPRPLTKHTSAPLTRPPRLAPLSRSISSDRLTPSTDNAAAGYYPHANRASIVSPKQPSRSRRPDWYPYYASYPEIFVESVIETYLPDANTIIDPWNGSGTTTTVCERYGVPSVGIDINPALTVIARARLNPRSQRSQLQTKALQSTTLATSIRPPPLTSDPLLNWMHPDAAAQIRAIEHSIHLTTNSPHAARPLVRHVDQLTNASCFLYCALFSVVRTLLQPFRTTNPTWFKTPPPSLRLTTLPWPHLSDSFTTHARSLCDRLTVSASIPYTPTAALFTANAMQLPFRSSEFEGALTSPPYATRIDYVRGTSPELAVLGADPSYISDLRRRVTGTPVVTDVRPPDPATIHSATANCALAFVASHPSKGSRSYYSPWLRNYLMDLQSGMFELARIVTPGGPICTVIQDSYYKEYRLDLQAIIAELMHSAGRTLSHRRDFPAPAPRSTILSTSGATLARHTTETLLVFK